MMIVYYEKYLDPDVVIVQLAENVQDNDVEESI